mgnify:CR=1 FL=1
MLIAHECAHALWTPYKEWEGITDKELRSYVNVIEDTRIDKLIQACLLYTSPSPRDRG